MPSVQDIYSLTPLQQGMLFHSLYSPSTGVYVEQRWCVIEGQLDVEAFQSAWNNVVNRHSILRSEFHWEETETPVQVVYDLVQPEWQLDCLTDAHQEADFEAFLQRDRERGFQLDRGPLLRFSLFPLGVKQHRFIWTYHHLLLDGWSNGLMIREVLEEYKNLKAFEDSKTGPASRGGATASRAAFRYRDFVEWHERRDVVGEREYWQNVLAGFDEPTHWREGLACAREIGESRSDSTSGYEQYSLIINSKLTARIQAFATESRLTLNTVMQAVWAILLHRYSGHDDVMFGATLSGRNIELEDVETALGLFINTVPVRVGVESDQTAIQWLNQIQSDQMEREHFGAVGLLELHEFTEVPSGVPLFDSLLIFENYPLSIEEILESDSGPLQLVDRDGYERTSYPLAVVIVPGDELRVEFRYESDKFANSAIQRIAAQIEVLLGHLVDHPQALVRELGVLSTNEIEQLQEWGLGPRIPVPAKAIHEQFRLQAEQSPDAIAIEFMASEGGAEQQVSYAQLNDWSDEIAGQLAAAAGGTEWRVGILCDRSPSLVAGLLGTLKAGGAYVPLDKEFPASRLQYCVEDARVDAIVTDSDPSEVERLLGETASRLPTIRLGKEQPAGGRDDRTATRSLRVSKDPGLAYVIYTSGSTGTPKGVTISHQNMSNFLSAMKREPGIRSGDKLLAVTTISFDIAVLEIFLPLINGATIVLATAAAARDRDELRKLIDRHSVTIMQATPGTWRLLFEEDEGGNQIRLSRILCGGEALDSRLASRLLRYCDELWNLYGPTETTVWSGALRVTEETKGQNLVPLGPPIGNTSFEILDRRGRRVPIGAIGQLYIGGDGLSPGYWGQPDRTKERFVNGLYATGDLVRVRDDGLLDFIERDDNQVKLRGYRIELGEIESVIELDSEVAQSVVLIRPGGDGENQLVAFVKPVLGSDRSLRLGRVRKNLKASLPSYMLPNQFIDVDEIPVTPNGKIDRKALAKFEIGQHDAAEGIERKEAFQSTREELVAEIWANILGRNRVDVHDSFFELGGHSLAATRVISRVRESLDVDVELRTLFENPTLRDFVNAIPSSSKGKLLSPIPRVPRARNQRLPLSSSQRRQWMMASLLPANSLYTVPTAIRIRGELSIDRLHESLTDVVAAHDVLRMEFHDDLGEPFAKVIDECKVVIELQDLQKFDPVKREAELQRRVNAQVRQPISLSDAPLWKSVLLRIAPDDHVLVMTFHHILLDGWSLGILVRDLTNAYQDVSPKPGNASGDAEVEASEFDPNPLETRYADYVAWQQQNDFAIDLEYWSDQLKGIPPFLELPGDKSRPAEQDFSGATIHFRITKHELDGIRQLGGDKGTTLFMTLLAAFVVLIYRYSGATDFAVGTPVANRSRAEFESILGLFVNTVVLRNELDGNPSFDELLNQVRTTVLEAFEHQDMPFEQVVDAVGAERSRAASPLFQVLFTLQNAPIGRIQIPGLEWTPYPVEAGTSKFDISLALREEGDELHGQLEYRTDLFESESIEKMAEHYRQLLRILPSHLEQPISSVSLLEDADRQLLDEWAVGANVGQSSEDKLAGDKGRQVATDADTIHGIFTAQAVRTPSATALVSKGERWSYQLLAEYSNQLSATLVDLGVGLEARVGIMASRSAATVGAMLAVLKAGAAYVPLDANLPKARFDWMIGDAGCDVILSDTPDGLARLVHDRPVQELTAVSHSESIWMVRVSGHRKPGAAHAIPASRDSLAYVMYTSGSTGRPRGVGTPHRGVTRLVRNTTYLEFGSEQVFLQAAPLGFDASTLEIWGPLLNGGQLILPKSEELTLEKIADLVSQHQVTTLWLTSGLFNAMVDECLADRLASLKQLLVGGDIVSLPHLRRASQAMPDTEFINGYGPTECTTFACSHTFSRDELSGNLQLRSAPIGKPISNTTAYVLDRDLQRVPGGVPGELFVGGAGLARGYLNDVGQTAERFVPNPFFDVRRMPETDQNTTLYRTGDRVRFRSDGSLEFLGRIDQQVKVRGFRIEPAEIELHLKRHPGVSDAVITVSGDDAASKRLVAHLIRAGGQDESARIAMPNSEAEENEFDTRPRACSSLERQGFREFLGAELPVQSIPTIFQWLEAFPLSANGKVDRHALPGPCDAGQSDDEQYEPNEVEKLLVQIWSSLLTPKKVGVHDNFFELGGDSIMALQIVSRAARLGLSLTPAQLFQYQTVSELSQVVTRRKEHTDSEYAEPSGATFDPTPIQSWFLERRLAKPQHFNQSVCVALPFGIDRIALDAALGAVFLQHDALRMRLEGGRLDYRDEDLPECDWFGGDELARVAVEMHANIDLQHGPLFRVCGFESNSEDQHARLLFVAHHFVVDVVSWRIFLEDLHDAYNQAIELRPILLPAKTASYETWSNALAQSVDKAMTDYDHWRGVAQQANSIGESGKVERHRVSLQGGASVGRETRKLRRDLTDPLLHSTNSNPSHKVIHDYLLTAMAGALAEWRERSSITIDLERHGRNMEVNLGLDLDVSRTVGWFTSLYPVNFDLQHQGSVSEQLTCVTNRLVEVPNDGITYGILRYLGQREELAVPSIFAFNYLGQIDQLGDAGGFHLVEAPGRRIATENSPSHEILVNCWSLSGELHFEWIYSKAVVKPVEVSQLIQNMIDRLTALLSVVSPDHDGSEQAFGLASLNDVELRDVIAQVSFKGTKHDHGDSKQ